MFNQDHNKRNAVTSDLEFQLCVIGAGSAGLSVAAGAAQLGLKTILVEQHIRTEILDGGVLGGDCLHTGCVPSKALLTAAKSAHANQHPKPGLIQTQPIKIDFAAVQAQVQQAIATIAPHDSVKRFENLGVKVIAGHAEFLNGNQIQIKHKGKIKAKVKARYFVLAIGSKAAIPPIPGLDKEKILTHETIFNLTVLPKHLIILGGGPIGVEMAQAHQRLGAKVSLIQKPELLANADHKAVALVRQSLLADGIDIYEHANVTEVSHDKNDIRVKLTTHSHGKTKEHNISGSHLLIAAGRKTEWHGLHAEKAGVKFQHNGKVKLNAKLQTDNRRIYVAGDAAGGPQFTHAAGYHAGIIIRNICFKMRAKVNYNALPAVTYTSPELAQVGLTEQMAKAQFGAHAIAVSQWDFAQNDRAIAEHDTVGFAKIIIGKKGKSRNKILGATIVGTGAGDLIASIGLAIDNQLKLTQLAGLFAAYPTRSEIVKRAAGAYFTPLLFSAKTRWLVKLLQLLP